MILWAKNWNWGNVNYLIITDMGYRGSVNTLSKLRQFANEYIGVNLLICMICKLQIVNVNFDIYEINVTFVIGLEM